eukprot:Hpha_TRINITY_DN15433_c0_g4::TRINITY_DN15433_c0_g4_i1::g.175943::m.175943
MPAHESLLKQQMQQQQIVKRAKRPQTTTTVSDAQHHAAAQHVGDLRRELARVVRERGELHSDVVRLTQEKDAVEAELREKLRKVERRALEAEHSAGGLQRRLRSQERELDARRQQLDELLAKSRLYADHPSIAQQRITVSAPLTKLNSGAPSPPSQSAESRAGVVVAAMEKRMQALTEENAKLRAESQQMVNELEGLKGTKDAQLTEAQRLYSAIGVGKEGDTATTVQFLNAQIAELHRELSATTVQLKEERQRAADAAEAAAAAEMREHETVAQLTAATQEPPTLRHPMDEEREAELEAQRETIAQLRATLQATHEEAQRLATETHAAEDRAREAEDKAQEAERAAAAQVAEALVQKLGTKQEEAEREPGKVDPETSGKLKLALKRNIQLTQELNDALERQEVLEQGVETAQSALTDSSRRLAAAEGEAAGLRAELDALKSTPVFSSAVERATSPVAVSDATPPKQRTNAAATPESSVATVGMSPAEQLARGSERADEVMQELLATRQALRELSSEKDKVSLRADELEIALHAAQGEHRAAADDGDALRQEVRTQQQMHAATTGQLRSAEQLIARGEATQRELREQVRQLEEERRYHVGEIMGASDEFKQILSEQKLTSQKLQEIMAEREAVKCDLDDALGRAAQLEHLVRAKELENGDLVAAYRQLGEELERLSSQLRTSERDVLRLREEKQGLEEGLLSERTEARGLREREQQLLVDLQSMQFEHDAIARRALEFQKAKGEVEREVEDLRAVLAQAQRGLRESEKMLADRERDTVLAANELERVKERGEEIHAHESVLKRQVDQERRRIDELERLVGEGRVREIRTQSAMEKMQQELVAAREALQVEREERVLVDDREKRATMFQAHSRKTEEELRKELSQERGARSALEREVAKLRRENAALEEKEEAGLRIIEAQDSALRRTRLGELPSAVPSSQVSPSPR